MRPAVDRGDATSPQDPAPSARRTRGAVVVVALIVGAVLLRGGTASAFDHDALQTWATVFVSITLQSIPFLTMGVVLSGAVAAFVSPGSIERLLPERPSLAVPAAGIAGIALPGCECGSVPVSGRLVAGGAPAAAALTFLLAAPAINPVVLVSTSVAFPDDPAMVAARFVASLSAAVIVGWIWVRIGDDAWVERARRRVATSESGWIRFRDASVHDLLHAGGYLVVGAAAAAALQTFVPVEVLDRVGGQEVASIAVMAVLAVTLSICSEADAFVAASFSAFSRTSQLVFMVVGPMVDLKLVALQIGVFSRQLAVRFAPLTFVVAMVAATTVGSVLL